MPQARPGLALGCRPEGEVVEILHDGLGTDAAPGRTVYQLFADDSRAALRELLRAAGDVGTASAWLVLSLADGRRKPVRGTALATEDRGILLVAAPVSPQEPGADSHIPQPSPAEEVATADAVAELQRLDAELEATRLELERSAAALRDANRRHNELLGMTAHDLRNPLQAVRGFAETLQRRASERLGSREQLMLERIVASSDHMLSLVHELLTVSELEAGEVRLERTSVDVAQIVDSAVALLMSTAEGKDIQLSVSGTDAAATAEVDQRKIEQVVLNVLSNAIKFSDPGGAVDVEVAADDGVIRIAIRDEGPGIASDEIAELFRPFGRTSARATAGERSTGLGLPIARSIVEHHGGTITVDSEVGRGSTFTVELPRVPPPPAPPIAEPAP